MKRGSTKGGAHSHGFTFRDLRGFVSETRDDEGTMMKAH
jgi:hypothetical protein